MTFLLCRYVRLLGALNHLFLRLILKLAACVSLHHCGVS
jgi:hypothetical protein